MPMIVTPRLVMREVLENELAAQITKLPRSHIPAAGQELLRLRADALIDVFLANGGTLSETIPEDWIQQ
jgi:hypothetical protein